MSAIVLEGIVQESAELERLVPTPVEPLGYGRDLSCASDITETLDEVDEFSPEALWEASVRRLTCDRGELPDGGDPEDLEYGWSIKRLLHRGLTPAEIRDASGQIQQEVTKDDRIAAASVVLTQRSREEIRIDLTLTPVGSRESFTRTLALTPEGVREL